VLTSHETFSGSEELAYDLKVLKRATIVGEVTGGGANPGDSVSLPHSFSIFVPSGRAVNPITKTNWEGGNDSGAGVTDQKRAISFSFLRFRGYSFRSLAPYWSFAQPVGRPRSAPPSSDCGPGVKISDRMPAET
jgi:hypothetical protein